MTNSQFDPAMQWQDDLERWQGRRHQAIATRLVSIGSKLIESSKAMTVLAMRVADIRLPPESPLLL